MQNQCSYFRNNFNQNPFLPPLNNYSSCTSVKWLNPTSLFGDWGKTDSLFKVHHFWTIYIIYSTNKKSKDSSSLISQKCQFPDEARKRRIKIRVTKNLWSLLLDQSRSPHHHITNRLNLDSVLELWNFNALLHLQSPGSTFNSKQITGSYRC